MKPIHVVYSRREYLEVLMDFMPIEIARRAKLKSKPVSPTSNQVPWYMRATIYPLGSLMFFYKVNKVGPCVFTIDSVGVERDSKMGKLVVPWEEVTNVFALSNAYLIEKTHGAMPLPFRCLSPADRAEFLSLVGSKIVGVPSDG